MKLGYLAVGHRGTTLKLTGKNHPRKQLLDALKKKHAEKIFQDIEEGKAKHTGYIVNREWFDIFEVHDWTGGKA